MIIMKNPDQEQCTTGTELSAQQARKQNGEESLTRLINHNRSSVMVMMVMMVMRVMRVMMVMRAIRVMAMMRVMRVMMVVISMIVVTMKISKEGELIILIALIDQ